MRSVAFTLMLMLALEARAQSPQRDGADYSVSVDVAACGPGKNITVHWRAPIDHKTHDWIGVYPVDTPNTAYGPWQYVPFGSSGSLTFTTPNTDGNYELRYLLDDGYTRVAVSKRFVVSTPFICRDLHDGDPYYPAWTRCCDQKDKVLSDWTPRGGSAEGYKGSCGSWGVRP